MNINLYELFNDSLFVNYVVTHKPKPIYHFILLSQISWSLQHRGYYVENINHVYEN